EPTTVLELPGEAIARIAADRPELHARLVANAAQIVAGRLRVANDLLAGSVETHPARSGGTRREKDLLGERELSDHVYYGIQTLRALENFPITGIPIKQYHHLIAALAAVKEGA